MSLAGILRVKLPNIEFVIQCWLSEGLVVALGIATCDNGLSIPHVDILLAILNPDVNRCTLIVFRAEHLGRRSPIQFLFSVQILFVVSFRIALHQGHLLGDKASLISYLGRRILEKVSLRDVILLRG